MGRELKREGRSVSRRQGQALVEAALVMPILLLMLVGIMVVGRAWSIHQVVTDAARQGARKAAIWHKSGLATDSATAAVLRSLAAASVTFDPATDRIVVDPGTEEATVTVEVKYDFALLAPVMAFAGPSWGNGNFMLKSSAVMRNE